MKHMLSIFACVLVLAGAAAAAEPPAPPRYQDPVPHELITQPYRVCQDLEELTARIDNLYRKPFHKLFDKNGVMQPETVIFKDTISGHEVVSVTRELCNDISHSDLARPVWTCDGRKVLFMGNRGYIDADGKFQKTGWDGHKYIMNGDYTNQRALMVTFKDKFSDVDGRAMARSAGIYSKFNIMDRNNPKYAYYAVRDKLWRVTLSDDLADNVGELLCQLSNAQVKIIQDISPDGRFLLIQDANAPFDRKEQKPAYMPEIHLVDLTKKPGEAGAYLHHPFDYALPEVTDPKGKVVHAATNNYQFHSLSFGPGGTTIHWNYGPMTDVGEYLGWSLDITKGLDGTPTHGEVTASGGVNPWGQYESHGKMIGGGSTLGLYFSGPAVAPASPPAKGKETGGWGIWIRDYADDKKLPRFVMAGPGGHVAGGNSQHPDIWAAYMSAGWRAKVKESDCIVWGYASQGKGEVLCHTYSDVRGGLQKDRATGKYAKWSGMDNNDFRPYAAIPRPLLSPDATKLWFHSSMLMPAEEWVGIYVAVVRRPEPPRELRLGKNAKDVELWWNGAKVGFEMKGFHVYRGDAEGKNLVEFTDAAIAEKAGGEGAETFFSFTDKTAAVGQNYTYAITAEDWSGLESDTTSEILVVSIEANGPRLLGKRPAIKGWDKTPPPPVTGFTVTNEPEEDGQYRLKWDKSPAKDLRYYNLYFSTKGQPEVGPKRLIMSPPANMTEYLDWSAPLGAQTVYYAITAVDRQGNESQPAYATIPAGK